MSFSLLVLGEVSSQRQEGDRVQLAPSQSEVNGFVP